MPDPYHVTIEPVDPPIIVGCRVPTGPTTPPRNVRLVLTEKRSDGPTDRYYGKIEGDPASHIYMLTYSKAFEWEETAWDLGVSR